MLAAERAARLSPPSDREDTTSADYRGRTAHRLPRPEACGRRPTAIVGSGSTSDRTAANRPPAPAHAHAAAPQRSGPYPPRTGRTRRGRAQTPGLAGIRGPIGDATGGHRSPSKTCVAVAPRFRAGTIGTAGARPVRSAAQPDGRAGPDLRAYAEVGSGGWTWRTLS